MKRSVFNAIKLSVALAALIALYRISYRSGYEDGSRSLGYWDGWKDAMSVTSYGTVPYKGMK